MGDGDIVGDAAAVCESVAVGDGDPVGVAVSRTLALGDAPGVADETASTVGIGVLAPR